MIITEKKSKLISYVIYVWFALILVADHKNVIFGVREGLAMCYRYIIPSLFMMSVMSCVLISSPYSENLLTRTLSKLFALDKSLGGAVFFGLIAGFPSGAIGTFEAYERGLISQNECERAVCFTNNAGLAFIIGTVGALMGDIRFAVILWISQTLASLTLSNIFRSKKTETGHINRGFSTQISLVDAVKKAASAMITVCAFVCFFTALRILVSNFLARFVKNELIHAFASSFLEIGNAVFVSSGLSRYSGTLCCFAVGFGGFSAILQSVAVCPCVKITRYLAARILMGILCTAYVGVISFVVSHLSV